MPDLTINAAGMFLCGGPTGDNGTTGKKLVMDAYGPGVPIGGGAWSGKDFHKPDRVGGLLARRMALKCVHAGIGRRVRVQLEYRPNSATPESVQVWGRRGDWCRCRRLFVASTATANSENRRGRELPAPSWEHIVNDESIVNAENIALCCVGCNASKGTKPLGLWLDSKYCSDRSINMQSVAAIVATAIAGQS